jgi:signal peptidase I
MSRRVLVNKILYDFHAPRRGAIIVFAAPGAGGPRRARTFVKRIIGVGGDHMVCCGRPGATSAF